MLKFFITRDDSFLLGCMMESVLSLTRPVVATVYPIKYVLISNKESHL